MTGTVSFVLRDERGLGFHALDQPQAQVHALSAIGLSTRYGNDSVVRVQVVFRGLLDCVVTVGYVKSRLLENALAVDEDLNVFVVEQAQHEDSVGRECGDT